MKIMRTPKSLKCSLMLLIAAAGLAALPGVASAAKPKLVTVKGYTVEYFVPKPNVKLLAGTKISVAEYPKLKTVSKADGSFSIKVPAKAKVTLVAAAPDHLVTSSSTRVRSEKDGHLTFYLPTLALTRGLSALLTIPLNADQTASKACVIGLNVVNKSAANYKYTTPQQDAAAPSLGLPGAAVRMSPSLGYWGQPFYFDLGGIPDQNLTSTGANGGLLFANVPAGTYKVSASKAGSKFDPFTATCKPGRFVGAFIFQR
jgi:hypothetical protein